VTSLIDIYHSKNKNDVMGVIRTLFPDYDRVSDTLLVKKPSKRKEKSHALQN